MKSLKKLISIFLVLLLVVAVFPLGEKSISYADEKVFSDIDNHYAKQTILNWVDKGLIKGYDDGTFKPNKNITRAEFVHIISDYLNLTEKSEVSFKDVPNDAWYFDDLSKVVNKKLINGYEDNTFRANKNITRQEACVIVAKMSDNLPKVKDVHFTDENSFPSWAKENIIKLAQAGIISGYSDTTFKAKNNITRAEIVIVLDKIESQKQKIKEYKKEDKPKEENKQDKKGKLSSGGGGGGSYQSNSNNEDEDNIDIQKDTDNDGLSDYIEKKIGSDPNKADTDGDGLSDFEEYGVSNILVADADEDTDKDGISNYDEIKVYFTSPIYSDTDFDEISDYDEIFKYKTDPNKIDTDDDGINDKTELDNSLDPNKSDKGENITVNIYKNDIDKMDNFSLNINIPAEELDKISVTSLSKYADSNITQIDGYIGGVRVNAPVFNNAKMVFYLSNDLSLKSTTENSLAINPTAKSTTSPALYYYNEKNDELEYVNGQIYNKADKTITLDAKHFSTYVVMDKNKIQNKYHVEKENLEITDYMLTLAQELSATNKNLNQHSLKTINQLIDEHILDSKYRPIGHFYITGQQNEYKVYKKNTFIPDIPEIKYQEPRLKDMWMYDVINIGLSHTTFSDYKGNTLYCINGTDDFSDYLTDAHLGFIDIAPFKSLDFKLAYKKYKRLKNYSSDPNIYITGHSLGGRLAQEVHCMSIKDSLYPKKTVTFNAFGFTEIQNIHLKNLNSDIYKNITNYYVKKDLVGDIMGRISRSKYEYSGIKGKFARLALLHTYNRIGIDIGIPTPDDFNKKDPFCIHNMDRFLNYFYKKIEEEKQPNPASDFEFDKSTGTITKYIGIRRDVIIPMSIDGVSVTSIGDGAFFDRSLKSVVIPDSVTYIGRQSFYDNELTSVAIPNSVTYIGYDAFNHNNLASVFISDTVNEIKRGAFLNNRLSSVELSEDTIFDKSTFDESVTITRRKSNVPSPNPNENPASDFEFDKSTGTITKYIGTRKDVVIPRMIDGASVTSIGSWAFENNQLTSVEIPNSVTSIGNCAFENNQLTSVEIPNSVTSIGECAFKNNKLTSVEIPNSVTSIGNWAFANNQLTSVEIPNSVTSIKYKAFENNKLTSVEIPNSVTSIGGDAFKNNKLTSVVIPSSVTSIEEYAFAYNELISVEIPNSVTYIGNGTFKNNKLTSVVIPSSITSIKNTTFYDNQITSVTILGSVTSIGHSAFGVNKLTSVVIPNSVTSIGDGAFSHNQLTSVVIPNSVAEIGNSAFESNQLTSVELPTHTIVQGNAFDDWVTITRR